MLNWEEVKLGWPVAISFYHVQKTLRRGGKKNAKQRPAAKTMVMKKKEATQDYLPGLGVRVPGADLAPVLLSLILETTSYLSRNSFYFC